MAVVADGTRRSMTELEQETDPKPESTVATTAKVDDEGHDPAEQEDRPARSGGRGRSRWVFPAGVALAVAVVVALVAAVVFGIQAFHGWQDESRRADALAAGKQVAVNLTTFDYETADADVQRLHDSTTPDFENGFNQDSDAFIKVLRDGKVKMTGDTTEAGLLSFDGTTAHVTVAIKAQVTTAQSPQPDPRTYRMDISLVEQDGRWLANGAEFLA